MASQLEASVDRFISNEVKVDTFVNGDKNATYQTPTGDIVPSLSKFLNDQAQAGLFQPFETEASLLATIPTATKAVAIALDTKKIFLWEQETWHDTGADPVTIAHQQATELVNNLELKLEETIAETKKEAIKGSDGATRLLTSHNLLVQALITLTREIEKLDVKHSDAETRALTAHNLLTKTIHDAMNAITGGAVKQFPSNSFVTEAPNSIVVIELWTDQVLPVSKDQGSINGKIRYTVDAQVFECYTQFGVQGSSSAGFPKKNWSFDHFMDDTYTAEAKLKIGKVMAHSTWVFKANWIDHIQIRMCHNYALWAKVMDSRKGYPKRDIDHTYVGKIGAAAMETGATGVPVQYPAVVYINNEFYGVGCIGIGKKRDNYNIAKNDQNQIHFDVGGITSLSVLSPDAIDVKAPSTWGAGAEANKQRWLTFANQPQSEFTAQKDTYLDKNNIVDYYCFADFLAGADFVFKNLQFITWDGTKWFVMPYDLDMTYGLDFDGTVGRFPPNFDTFQGNDFWAKVYAAYRTDIEARYAELRRNGIFTLDSVYVDMKRLMEYYPKQLLEAEYAKWPLPSLAHTSFPHLMAWLKDRIAFLDTKFNFTA